MRSLIEILKNIEHLSPIDFREKEVPFVAKGSGTEADISSFGGTKEDYEFWRPYSCSTCCIKSIHNSVYPDKSISLFELVERSIEKGIFEVEGDEIKGAFHYPMRDLLHTMNIPAQVYALIEEATIVKALESGKVVILSVDLLKSRHISHIESHLITIYGQNTQEDTFTIHDSASVIVSDGNAAAISREYLEELSNHKGLVVG